MRNTAIILAAGDSSRFAGGLSKNLQLLNAKPVVLYSIEAFQRFDPSIDLIIVINKKDEGKWEEFADTHLSHCGYKLIFGGESRAESLYESLPHIEKEGIVFIHDAARPCVETDLIARLHETCLKEGNAVPTIDSRDSLRFKKEADHDYLDRSQVIQIQTPQCYHSFDLKKIFALHFDKNATDDSEIMMKGGMKMNYVQGSEKNIKITFRVDLDIASVILSKGKNG